MPGKKGKKQKQFKEKKLTFKKAEKKKPEVSVRIREEQDYAVLEPFTLSTKTSIKQKVNKPKEVVEIKKEEKKEEVKPKPTVQESKPKEIKPVQPVQKVLPKPPVKTTQPEIPISKIPIDHIETDIDRLLKLITEKKTVDLGYLSKELKIDVERLEIWAKLLEDRGFIEIEYPILGLPKLRIKGWKKKS